MSYEVEQYTQDNYVKLKDVFRLGTEIKINKIAKRIVLDQFSVL